MATIGSLIIKILADAQGLRSELQKAASSTQQFEKSVKAAGTVAATAFFSVTAAATAMTLAAGKQAESIVQLSSVTGINTDKLQEYDVMLNRAGKTGDDLAQVVKHISTSLDQARQGTGSAADRFRQLGVDIRGVTSTDELIRRVAQAASRFGDTLQKDAAMSDLLGKGYQTFLRVFAGGKKAFDETEAASRKLGLTMSTSNLAILTKMDDAVDDMGTAFMRFGQQVGVVVAPTIELLANIFRDLLAWGSHAMNGLNLLLDIYAVKLLHLGMKAQEIFGVLFSTDVFSKDAWTQALANIDLIAKEEEKQISKVRAMWLKAREPAPKDTRPAIPTMIDSSLVAQQQQALLDAQLKAKEQGLRSAETINRAGLANEVAKIDELRAGYQINDREMNTMKQAAMVEADKITGAGLETQLFAYRQFAVDRAATFTSDLKGTTDRVRFEEEAAGKIKQIEDDITAHAIQADTTRRQAGMQIKGFWQKQLDDIAASNVFSTGIIISAWTGGVANAIVNGGNFAQAAWKQTELALVQGALNLAVQWGITEAAKLAATSGAAAGVLAIWEGTAAAITGTFVTMTAAVMLFMSETVIPALVSIGEAVAEFLFALGEAETVTIFGAEVGIATIAAAATVLAAVGALAAFSFRKGGIGDFGSGQPAMLHGKEAIVPLDGRGAKFMQEAFGDQGGGKVIHTHVYLNRREIASAVSEDTPGALRSMGVF
jgi:hypothetical protein